MQSFLLEKHSGRRIKYGFAKANNISVYCQICNNIIGKKDISTNVKINIYKAVHYSLFYMDLYELCQIYSYIKVGHQKLNFRED